LVELRNRVHQWEETNMAHEKLPVMRHGDDHVIRHIRELGVAA
jgi:hypothetical protein